MLNTGELSASLRAERARRGWTLRQLAERASVAVRTVWSIERGESTGRTETVQRIAAALGVPLSTLIPDTAPEAQSAPPAPRPPSRPRRRRPNRSPRRRRGGK